MHECPPPKSVGKHLHPLSYLTGIGDCYFTFDELRQALDTVARSHEVSDLSRRSGISRPGIYKALGQDDNPSFETIRAILAGLGLRLTVAPAEREPEPA